MKNLVMNTLTAIELMLMPKEGELLIEKEVVKVMSVKEFLNLTNKQFISK